MKTPLLPLQAGLLLALPLASQGTLVDRVTATLTDHTRSFAPDTLEGPGMDWLLEEGRDAEFVLIGESHGNVQTPALTVHLLKALRDHGYRSYGIETGPVSTRLMRGVLENGGVAAFEKWSQRHPFGIAFMNWREEVAATHAALGAGYDVRGMDQEFIAGGRHLLTRLIELAPDDDARALATQWLQRAQRGFGHFAKTGDQSKGFMVVVTDDDFDAMDAAFAASAAARETLAELRASAGVYRAYLEKRYYDNNCSRVALIKRNFDALIDAAEARTDGADKIVVRMGSMHIGRGYNPLRQLDLGNHAAERAVARGGESLHLYVLARVSRRDGKDRPMIDSEGPMGPLLGSLPDDGTAVLDLRPLRPLLSSKRAARELPDLIDLAFRYDVAVIYPHFDAATEIVPSPR